MSAHVTVRLAADRELMEHDPLLLSAAGEGIADVFAAAGISGGYDTSLVVQSDSMSFIEDQHSYLNGQVSAEGLLDVLRQNHFASPTEPAYLLLGRDLRARGTNFIFGITDKQQGLSVQ